jgi:hypothetical protein
MQGQTTGGEEGKRAGKQVGNGARQATNKIDSSPDIGTKSHAMKATKARSHDVRHDKK